MILKFQISQNDNGKSVLIYNQDKSILHQFNAPEELKAYMDGSPKEYYMTEIKKDGSIRIIGKAPAQNW